MMPETADVSVIMPTTALTNRARFLDRALHSVLSQQDVRCVPIVVANGPHRDAKLIRHLRNDLHMRVIELETASLPAALRAGREAVDTSWFSALDDDDEYLPGSLAARVEALRRNPEFDTVVTNGLVRDQDGDELPTVDWSFVGREPLIALSEHNWMLPGAWLCCSDRVGNWLFEGMPKALECTYLAIQFGLRGKVLFLTQPTVVWYRNTPASESKSRMYVLRQVAALKRFLELPLPDPTKRWIRKNITDAYHRIAMLYLKERKLNKSWRAHLRSITGPGGARHLRFGLHIVLATLRE